MTLGDSVELYVGTTEGIMIIDGDGSGSLDRVREFASDLSLILGLAFDDGVLYAPAKAQSSD